MSYDFVPDADFIKNPDNDGYQLFVGNADVEMVGNPEAGILVMTAESDRRFVFPIVSELKNKMLDDLIQGGVVPRGSYVSTTNFTGEPSGGSHAYRYVVKIRTPPAQFTFVDRTLNTQNHFNALGDDLLGNISKYLDRRDGSSFARTHPRFARAWYAANRPRQGNWDDHFHNVLRFQDMLAALHRDHNTAPMAQIVDMLCTLLTTPNDRHLFTERGNPVRALDETGQLQMVRQSTKLPPFFITSVTHIIRAILADPGMLDRVVNALCATLTTALDHPLGSEEFDALTEAQNDAEASHDVLDDVLVGDKAYLKEYVHTFLLLQYRHLDEDLLDEMLERVRCRLFRSSLESPDGHEGGPILVIGGGTDGGWMELYFRLPGQAFSTWREDWFNGEVLIRPIFFKESDSEPWRLYTEGYGGNNMLQWRDQVTFISMLIMMLSVPLSAAANYSMGHGGKGYLRSGFV